MASTVGNPASNALLTNDNNMFVMVFLSSSVPLNRYFPRDWRFTMIANPPSEVLPFPQTQKTGGKKVPEKNTAKRSALIRFPQSKTVTTEDLSIGGKFESKNPDDS